MSIMLAQNPTRLCRIPLGIQAQSIDYRTGGWSIQWQWRRPDATLYLLSFYSFAPGGVDFQVRYCCPIGSFVGTTTTTTTPLPLDNTSCGKQKIAPRSSISNRIFGGTDAIPNSWPWMIFYQEKRTCGTNTCYGLCGGTLINANYIITAAHCVGTRNPSDITLVAGMHNMSSNTETTKRQFRTVQAIYVHPQYDTMTNMNDIAILRVSTPFTFTTYVQPACLPGSEPKPNDQVIIAGWGAQAFAGSVHDTLKQANTKVVDKCDSWWLSVDSSKQICVANSIDGSSACQGDSGGPILAQYNGQYVVSGIASYVKDCNTMGSSNAPNVYTRVAPYKAWIKSITN
ncbi:unnamed protein product [Rotaria sp. Silwood2]|nr:unnamed protein product [Rotaria sp. Silwood2]CAF2545121.1 unnamed protein product [Rotaria sp. Silwood2]CAF3305198.1 unnamed protein product [Rotaria sp. Silwood2]CAF3405641.1 unnamed protein product [Rotaria sp. Silwood2]CAF3925884.1 unnamed protein product [Rotaria sp. Silwood2]